jgi:hypothetical protein
MYIIWNIKHISTCKAIYIYIYIMFNIIQFIEKQINAIEILDTNSSNNMHDAHVIIRWAQLRL